MDYSKLSELELLYEIKISSIIISDCKKKSQIEVEKIASMQGEIEKRFLTLKNNNNGQ
jgi:hypothetical protein